MISLTTMPAVGSGRSPGCKASDRRLQRRHLQSRFC